MEYVAEIGFLEGLDQRISLAINSLNCPASDWIWTVFSGKLVWVPLYLLVAFFLIRRLGWKRGAVAIVAAILTIVACDQFANFTKVTFARLRPCHTPWMVDNGLRILEDKGGLYGFYSAHAANAMGFAVCTARCFRWDSSRRYNVYTVCLVIWAVLVGISRVFVGKHFFGDVLTGYFVGWAFATLISLLAGLIAGRLSRR